MDTKTTMTGSPVRRRQQGGGEGRHSAAVSSEEAVALWEALFDNDTELARDLFWDAVLRDARAERHREGGNDDGEEERRLARVFEQWQPPPAGSSVPPPVVLPPAVERTAVLGLRAAPHLARRPPPGPGGGRHPTEGMNKPCL
jgi:hypothetical protein